MERNALRKSMRERRDALPEEYRAAADRSICETLLDLPEYKRADTIFCYISVGSEVDTLPFIQRTLEGGKRVCAPALTHGGLMEAREIAGAEDLRPARFGLLEPKVSCPKLGADEIPFIVVPCICCDRKGNRIGYGGGYYDRYLAAPAKADIVVVCREKNICEDGRISPLPHDARANIVVTERGAFRCGAAPAED
ncbi:MAG: 5-formyltetrahydrofolate cyclo-ligase [Clostridiales Family XIII bacterium]|jgi:5-formyltetrahydrofolate cyclo-ligase|nr:5-formyltetrahydrofolate cyclo-ligase [Clostridiales Family XIII bacterium]